jgi:4-hydroxythreonine-4-phosphate dehydrogenase
MQIMMRPTIALAMGDPAGISPELTARLLALDDVAAGPGSS